MKMNTKGPAYIQRIITSAGIAAPVAFSLQSLSSAYLLNLAGSVMIGQIIQTPTDILPLLRESPSSCTALATKTLRYGLQMMAVDRQF
jgi:hypothetical protein